MATSFRFGGYAVRREFRKGFSFRGSMPPQDAAPRRKYRNWRGQGSSPYRTYVAQYNLIYREARSSYQGDYSGFRKWNTWNEWDTARFMQKRKRLNGWKELMNRAYRRAWRQQVHCGLEAPSEFKFPNPVNYFNISD